MKELMSMIVCLFLSALLGVMVATGWVLQKTTGVISCSPRLPERGSKNQALKMGAFFLLLFATLRVPVSGGQIQKNTGSW